MMLEERGLVNAAQSVRVASRGHTALPSHAFLWLGTRAGRATRGGCERRGRDRGRERERERERGRERGIERAAHRLPRVLPHDIRAHVSDVRGHLGDAAYHERQRPQRRGGG
jgi:hypothetical protein